MVKSQKLNVLQLYNYNLLMSAYVTCHTVRLYGLAQNEHSHRDVDVTNTSHILLSSH